MYEIKINVKSTWSNSKHTLIRYFYIRPKLEIFEINYFLAVAETQNINKAAQKLSVSAPALSRAVSRLEEELGVLLFERVGRNIRISENGKAFQKEAFRIISDLQNLKVRFNPNQGLRLTLTGSEFGLSGFVSEILDHLKKTRLPVVLDVKLGSGFREIERQVREREAHLGILTSTPTPDLKKLKLGNFESKTYVSSMHPLIKNTSSGKSLAKPIPVDKVLEHEFVTFDEAVFSDFKSSFDGWRDDVFKRKIGMYTKSVEVALRTIESGHYIGYLPEPIAKSRNLIALGISGCPYHCYTDVYLVASRDNDSAWLRRLFG